MGNEKLHTFTQLASDEKTVLIGVANAQSGHVIVEPDEFVSIIGDNRVIICRTPNNKFFVYKVSGELLGVFDLFNHWNDGGDYYLGSKYDMQVFYFPLHEEIVQSRQMISEIEAVLLFVDGEWQIRDYFGTLLWKQLPQNFTVIHAQRQDAFVIAAKEGSSYILYNKEGKKLAKLNATKWKKLQKKFQTEDDVENGATIAVTETLAPFI